jgi:hypothetical protein
MMAPFESYQYPFTYRNRQILIDISKVPPEELQISTEQLFRQKYAARSGELLVPPKS